MPLDRVAACCTGSRACNACNDPEGKQRRGFRPLCCALHPIEKKIMQQRNSTVVGGAL